MSRKRHEFRNRILSVKLGRMVRPLQEDYEI